jgi:hypothetical protein
MTKYAFSVPGSVFSRKWKVRKSFNFFNTETFFRGTVPLGARFSAAMVIFAAEPAVRLSAL